MARLKFGAFLAPHHPIGEHPMLQFRRDLDLVEQLDALGYDEFWCGEHHSSGWETIASPEMFLAAAGERTKRIKLGTGIMQLAARTAANAAMCAGTVDALAGGGRFIDVRYADLTARPIEEGQRVLAEAGVPVTDEIVAGMGEWVEANRREDRAVHKYSMADFGLESARIEEHFATYRARFMPQPVVV